MNIIRQRQGENSRGRGDTQHNLEHRGLTFSSILHHILHLHPSLEPSGIAMKAPEKDQWAKDGIEWLAQFISIARCNPYRII